MDEREGLPVECPARLYRAHRRATHRPPRLGGCRMTPEEQFAELFPIAKAAARAVYGGNRDYVYVDDLIQEAMLWLLEHPKRVEHAHLPDGGIYWPRIVSEVCKVLNAYVGKERLEAQGYEPFEHYAYSA